MFCEKDNCFSLAHYVSQKCFGIYKYINILLCFSALLGCFYWFEMKYGKCVAECTIQLSPLICPLFLAHLSLKLKWGFLMACCLFVCLFVFFHISIFFSRTTGPISTKLGTNNHLVKEIQISSKERSCPFPRKEKWPKIYIDNIWKSPPDSLG